MVNFPTLKAGEYQRRLMRRLLRIYGTPGKPQSVVAPIVVARRIASILIAFRLPVDRFAAALRRTRMRAQ
jgi:hypothetical protein